MPPHERGKGSPWPRRRWARFDRSQYAIYLAGCVTFSIGASFFIGAGLGTDPLDVLSLGLKKQLAVTVGIAQAGFAGLCLLVHGLWNRRLPPLSPLITFFLCGSLIDVWMAVHFVQRVGLPPVTTMLCGVAACAFGSAFILMSGIGVRAMDLVALTAHLRLGVPFWLGKGVLELTLLVSGWLLGGPVGVGTIVFLACVGWLIQPLVWFSRVKLAIPCYVELSRATRSLGIAGPTSM